MKLYELNREMTQLLESADPVTGEVDAKAFDSLSLAKEEKQKNVIMFVHHLSGDQEAIEKEIERLENMRKQTENAKNGLLNYLKYSMELDGVTELDFVTFKARIKKNPPKLELDKDCTAIPDKFWKITSTQTLDKKAVKEAIENGEEVPGCKLVQDTRLELK